MKKGDKVLVKSEDKLATVHSVKGDEVLVRLDPIKVDSPSGKKQTVMLPSPWRTVKADDLTPA